MIRYTSQNQLTIEEFKTPFEIKFNKENRWVKLGESMPWDALAKIYFRSMSLDKVAPPVDATIAIASMIIKHKMILDDREAIEAIRENMYMQYFLGLSEYTYEDVFDRALFTTLRYRLGAENFDAMTLQIILRLEKKYDEAEKDIVNQDNDIKLNESDDDIKESGLEENEEGPQANTTKGKQKKNKGKLLMNATVADQMIAYPTDLGLLLRNREESERLIDELCETLDIRHKPLTYRRLARKQYLNLAKNKNKSRKEIHKGIGQQ